MCAKNKVKVEAGEFVCVTTGEYSDFAFSGMFVVLKKFNPITELEKYLKSHPEQKEHGKFNEDGFLHALLRKGLLQAVQHRTIQLDKYYDTPADYVQLL